MSFGKNLARARKQRGWIQDDLVRESGVPLSTLKRYEGEVGSPRLEHVAKLARTLGVSADELIFDAQDGIPEARIMDAELLRLCEAIQAREAAEREALKFVLESVIVRKKLEGLLPPPARSTRKLNRRNDVTKLLDEALPAKQPKRLRKGTKASKSRAQQHSSHKMSHEMSHPTS